LFARSSCFKRRDTPSAVVDRTECLDELKALRAFSA
jgi:hypothetical protein